LKGLWSEDPDRQQKFLWINPSRSIQVLLFLLFVFCSAQWAFSDGYVTDIQGKVTASAPPYIQDEPVTKGVQLPNDIKLHLAADSRLDIFCPHSFQVKSLTESTDGNLCPGPAESFTVMRSDGQRDAPVLLVPRNKEIATLDEIWWGAIQPSKFSISITEIGGKEILNIVLATPEIIRKPPFPTYHYKMDKIITDKLLPGKFYQIVIRDEKHNKSTASDKNFDGIVTISPIEKRKHIKPLPRELKDLKPEQATYLKALNLKEQGMTSDAFWMLNTIKDTSYNHLVQYQIAQLFLDQQVPVDFAAFELVRAIQYSSAENDFLTAYLGCTNLKTIYFRLSPLWKNQIATFKQKKEFNKACPLF